MALSNNLIIASKTTTTKLNNPHSRWKVRGSKTIHKYKIKADLMRTDNSKLFPPISRRKRASILRIKLSKTKRTSSNNFKTIGYVQSFTRKLITI